MAQKQELGNTKNGQNTGAAAGGIKAYWLPAVFLLAAVVFAVRNLPWHLDNYDQAKQAFAAMDVIRGNWLLQFLPMGGYATKPPLVAWLQAGVYYLSLGNWALAWRLPGYLSALAMLWFVSRAGRKMFGLAGAVVAAAAFAFNMLSIRIATLVRTDMVLALLCFLPGLMVWQHVRLSEKWTRYARIVFLLLLLAGILTKGHAVYAFFVPGLLVYAGIMRQRKKKDYAWPGWVVLLSPLVIFLLLAVWVAWRNPAYYEQIIVGEIYSVFASGNSEGHAQPVYYYGIHLLQKWAPWSLLLLVFLVCDFRNVRSFWRDSEFVWLVCWVLGGLLVMSLVPQKRVDRIYPVIAPLSLLLVYFIGHTEKQTLCRIATNRFIPGLVVLGIVGWSVYTAVEVTNDCRNESHGLKLFSRRIIAEANGKPVEVVAPCAEGFMCYFNIREPAREGSICAHRNDDGACIMVSEKAGFEEHEAELIPYTTLGEVVDPFSGQQYICVEID